MYVKDIHQFVIWILSNWSLIFISMQNLEETRGDYTPLYEYLFESFSTASYFHRIHEAHPSRHIGTAASSVVIGSLPRHFRIVPPFASSSTVDESIEDLDSSLPRPNTTPRPRDVLRIAGHERCSLFPYFQATTNNDTDKATLDNR